MAASEALIERLRAKYTVADEFSTIRRPVNPDGFEAADHIEKLEADKALLREALEWALCEIRSDTRYDNEEQFWNAYDLATDALHSGKDEK